MSRIQGGEFSNGPIPFQLQWALKKYMFSISSFKHFCGATLITKRHAVSAIHCCHVLELLSKKNYKPPLQYVVIRAGLYSRYGYEDSTQVGLDSREFPFPISRNFHWNGRVLRGIPDS